MEKKSPYYLFRRIEGDGTHQKNVFKIHVGDAVRKMRENLRKLFKNAAQDEKSEESLMQEMWCREGNVKTHSM